MTDSVSAMRSWISTRRKTCLLMDWKSLILHGNESSLYGPCPQIDYLFFLV
jgi:hypothetical protein